MDTTPPELLHDTNWRTAVWALRVGSAGLAVVIVGVILLASGSTPGVLAAGVAIWLGAAVVTLVGFFRARNDLPEPRPGFWPMRWMLLHDTTHARPTA